MPWLFALLGLGALGLAAGTAKSSGGSGGVNFALVRQWAEERGMVAYYMGPGWDHQTACFSRLSCGRQVDIIVDSRGRFWRPDPAGTRKCSSGDDLRRAFLAWQQAR